MQPLKRRSVNPSTPSTSQMRAYCSTGRLALVLCGMILATLALQRVATCGDATAAPGKLHRSPYARLQAPGPRDVMWTNGFWKDRYDLCAGRMVTHIWRVTNLPDNAATFWDFRKAAGLAPKEQPGGVKWSDGDCHKVVETLTWLYAQTGDPRFREWIEEAVAVIAKAQEPDGYLSTWVQLSGVGRWKNIHNHELYNMGHLMTAGAIHYALTGEETYLNVARRAGDYLYRVFSPCPPELAHFGFNPSYIMGAVDLYRVTGEKRYLELAQIFVDMRGSRPGGSNLNQDLVPLRKESEAVGHCVTATYLWCGAADVYAETGEQALIAALKRIWSDVTERKMYVTGGIGSIHFGVAERQDRPWPKDPVHEAFGRPYELPNRTAYNETCANIGNAMWNWRLFNLTGDARYMEVVERVLYNSMLSGMSLDGTAYFYTNPLHRCGPESTLLSNDSWTRWPDCTPDSPVRCFCCPPNLARTLASLHRWAYSLGENEVWVNIYGGSRLRTQLGQDRIELVQETMYPWEGKVRFVVQEAPDTPVGIHLRIPSWARGATISVCGEPTSDKPQPGSYFAVRRIWAAGDTIELDLPMEPVLVTAHPLVESCQGKVAVMRGPVVYCFESADLPESVDLDDMALVATVPLVAQWKPDLLGGVVAIEAELVAPDSTAQSSSLYAEYPRGDWRRFRARLIPYYAWCNRGATEMTVWIPVQR